MKYFPLALMTHLFANPAALRESTSWLYFRVYANPLCKTDIAFCYFTVEKV